MATQAHCAYCFESLAATLEKRTALSLRQVEELWEKYHNEISETSTPAGDGAYKPAAISRLLSPSIGSASSSSLQSSGGSTLSERSSSSDATSQSSNSKHQPNSRSNEPSTPSTEDDSDSDLNVEDDTEEDEEAHPLFVTWNTLPSPSSSSSQKRLRGCIGTFTATPLSSGLHSYALTSALHDTRFSPITHRELPSLQVAVTLLTDFERAADAHDWAVGVHGLRISFADARGRSLGATYLPDVAKEQGWSKDDTLLSLMRKAGWSGRADTWRDVTLDVVRYQGRKVALGYAEWRAWRDWVRREAGR
ncbi:hypothetical protein ACN47E_009651 [Coniothyrium glycines]